MIASYVGKHITWQGLQTGPRGRKIIKKIIKSTSINCDSNMIHSATSQEQCLSEREPNKITTQYKVMAGPMRPQIVLFGSSIIQMSFDNGGWGAILANLYARKVIFFLLYIILWLLLYIYFHVLQVHFCIFCIFLYIFLVFQG